MMHPENIDYTNTLIASIGLFGIILGAIITGGIQIYSDRIKLKNEKLSTAYAYKGEIQSLLEIIEILINKIALPDLFLIFAVNNS